VDQPQAAFFGAGVLPIGQSGHRSTGGSGQPDADGRIRRTVAVSVVPAFEIEDYRNRPRSEGNVGQDRMEGMP
jgi:hypothetical protein